MRLVLVIVMTTALALGVSAVVCAADQPDACTASCPGDAPDGECPSFCGYCACCISASPLAVKLATPFHAIETCHSLSAGPVERPGFLHHADIFHVPKLLVA